MQKIVASAVSEQLRKGFEMSRDVLIQVNHLKKYFNVSRGILGHHIEGTVKAVDDVSLSIYRGETLGLIGESGCGKSTLSRVLLGLISPTDGEVIFEGKKMNRKALKEFRTRVQMVFQDPYSSIDPRMCMRRIIEEPLRIHTSLSRSERMDLVLPLIKQLGFDEEDLKKYPHEFSGGQRQRIGIARAFILEPSFIICDEPVSALDVSIQAQILNLFRQLQREKGVTYLFISHDMAVIKHISDRIAVMYLGHIVELASKDELFSDTLHPYTKALIESIPVPDPRIHTSMKPLEGELPSPINPPSGCPFRLRCRHAMDICASSIPELREIKEGHFAACHLFDGRS